MLGELTLFRVIEDSDLERLVRQQYPGCDYCFMADVLGKEDSCIEIDLSTPERLEDVPFAEKDLERFKRGEVCDNITRVLLVDLIRRHILTESNYLIRIH